MFLLFKYLSKQNGIYKARLNAGAKVQENLRPKPVVSSLAFFPREYLH